MHSKEVNTASKSWFSSQRISWLILFVLASVALSVALWLEPNPQGHGTHTQLGLPPCGFLVVTGLPCPGCGMTTSFSNMVRADVVAAALANPFGIPLSLATMFFIPLSILGIIRDWHVLDVFDALRFDRIALWLAFAGLISWFGRLAASFSW